VESAIEKNDDSKFTRNIANNRSVILDVFAWNTFAQTYSSR